jgi:protein O-mannosyl-transferase
MTALAGGFTWLDHAHLEGGLAVRPPSEWLALFTRGFAGTGYYRPFTALSLSVDATLGGGPLLFHATSVAFHSVAAVLVVVASEALGLSRRAAVLAGMLFAVHPVTMLVAGAIAFRSEAMLTTALLALVWAHRGNRPAVAGLAVFCGALTKETALVLAPLFVGALEVSALGRAGPTEAPRRRLFAAEATALAAAVGLRFAFAPSWRASHEPLGVGDALGTRFASLAKSAASLVMPIDRSICDAFAVTHLWQPASLAGGAGLAALAFGAWKKRGPMLLLALAVLPSLQLVPVSRWWSPHYLYVPLAFVAMLAAETAVRLGRRATLAAGAACVVLGALTFHDGLRLANDTSLWAPEVARQPACREGHFYLGEVARDAGQWEVAARRYQAALAPRPRILAYVDRAAALQNLGVVRVEQGRFGEAREAFRIALEGTRDLRARRELTHDLAAATLSDGDAEEAARLLEAETARPDALPQSIHVRALALEKLGRQEEARAMRQRLGR